MTEKRTASRIPVDHPVPLTIDDEIIEGCLVNLSQVGALFAFEGDRRFDVDQSLLGLDGTFRIKPKGKKIRLYTGELVRFYIQDETSYLALRFWQKPVELDD